MDRVAVFVDAGYLFAEGSRAICGTRLPREEVVLDQALVREKLVRFATRVSDLPVLRIYWYDGAWQGQTAQHESLAEEEGIKLRLGQMNRSGGQHNVDALIINDMITLARNHAMADCVLVSGDGDLYAGMEQVQDYGVKVHLVGIAPTRETQSTILQQEADSTNEWSEDFLKAFLTCQDMKTVVQQEMTKEHDPGAILQSVAEQIAEEVLDEDVKELVEQIQMTNRRPQELDGRLLAFSRNQTGHELGEAEKSKVREAFLEVLVGRMAPPDNDPDGNKL